MLKSTDEDDEEEINEEIKYEESIEMKSENGNQVKAQVSLIGILLKF